MGRYIIVSVISGILFGLLDGLINANPIAVKLYEAYRPIAKTSLNFVAGILIDQAYGFILAGLFLLLYPSLPGGTGLARGVSFGLLVWFFTRRDERCFALDDVQSAVENPAIHPPDRVV